jgi:ketosteroid isomerase-like protein
MGAEDASAVVRRFYADFDTGDIDSATAVFSDDLETTDPGMGTVHGLAPFREYLVTLKRALPDAVAIIDAFHDAGDVIVVEGRFAGTFTGPLAGAEGDAEPTGASVELRFADVLRVADGQIVAYHTYYDQLGLMTQLGLTVALGARTTRSRREATRDGVVGTRWRCSFLRMPARLDARRFEGRCNDFFERR